jgi:acyl carrier protein
MSILRTNPQSPTCWSSPKIRINDQIVSLLPRRYRVDGAVLPKCVRAPRGDGRTAVLSGDLLVAACRVWEKSGKTMDAQAAPRLEFDANKVRALIARYLSIDVEQLTDEVHFRNDFELDSLDQLELLILIEEEFSGVEFSDAAVDRIEVVGDLIRHIEITNKILAA